MIQDDVVKLLDKAVSLATVWFIAWLVISAVRLAISVEVWLNKRRDSL
jgi:hypothetical protein